MSSIKPELEILEEKENGKDIMGTNKDLFSAFLRPCCMPISCSVELYKEVKWKKNLPSASTYGTQIIKGGGSVRKMVEDSDGGK